MTNSISRQILLLILGISLLLIAVAGVSYALYSTVYYGSRENVISTGTISISYADGNDGVTITNLDNFDDNMGKLLTGDGNVFDFTVNSDISKFTTIYYEIVVEEMDEKLKERVKLFLQKRESFGFVDTDITRLPQRFYNNMSLSEIPSLNDGMVLYKGILHNDDNKISKVSEQFRLKAWISDDSSLVNFGEVPEFKLKVYGKVVY